MNIFGASPKKRGGRPRKYDRDERGRPITKDGELVATVAHRKYNANRNREVNLDVLPEVPSPSVQHHQTDPTAVVHATSTSAQYEAGQRTETTIPIETATRFRTGGRVRRGRFQDALAIITEPERKGEGFRLGALGNTGKGKTFFIRRFVLEHPLLNGITIIHDDSKRNAQYENHQRASYCVPNFQAAPDDARVVTIRGNAQANEWVEVDSVAGLALTMSRNNINTRLVVDELDRAITPGGKEFEGTNLRSCFTVGRALGLSVLWSTQAPQRAPREVIDQSTAIVLFQIGPRALNYLDDRLMFDGELLDVVPTLQVGEFVIYQQGMEWNRTIYY